MSQIKPGNSGSILKSRKIHHPFNIHPPPPTNLTLLVLLLLLFHFFFIPPPCQNGGPEREM